MTDRDYNIGDFVWIFVGNHHGEMSKGTIVATLDLPGWQFRNYVIEVPTSIDSLLEVRCAQTMRPSDPRIGQIASVIIHEYECDGNHDKATSVAIQILDELGLSQ